MGEHEEKLEKVVRKAAAEFLLRESNGASLITVTRVQFSKDGKYATILVTVLPEDKEDSALEFVQRKRSDFIEYVKGHTKIGRLPYFDFQIDSGEKHRQKLDTIPL